MLVEADESHYEELFCIFFLLCMLCVHLESQVLSLYLVYAHHLMLYTLIPMKTPLGSMMMHIPDCSTFLFLGLYQCYCALIYCCVLASYSQQLLFTRLQLQRNAGIFSYL